MNKRDLGRQREDRILVAEEEILHRIENRPRTSTRRLVAQEIRQNRGILNRVRVSTFLEASG
jgi:hypothetical protein